jgi:hypothetical protein
MSALYPLPQAGIGVYALGQKQSWGCAWARAWGWGLNEFLNNALDLAAEMLGGASGYDGKWRWVSSRDQQPVELYFSIEEPDQLYLHINCPNMPIKFSQLANVRQLRTLLEYVQTECR